MNAVVLSSETPEATAAFYAQRLGIEPVEPAKPAVESPDGAEAPDKPKVEGKGSEQEQAPPPDTNAEGDGEASPEPESKVHRRFSELTTRAKEAEAKAAEAERRALLAEQHAQALRLKHEPPQDDLGPEPKLDQFNNATEFAAALKDWTTESVKRETAKERHMSSLAAQWAENEKAARETFPDFEAVIAKAADLTVPTKVRDALLESPQGPFILHHLANDPAELSKLQAMAESAQLRYIGKLEGKFEATRTSKPAASDTKSEAKPATAAAVEISRAPAPINPLKGGSPVAESPVDSEGVYHGTYEDYKAARRAGRIK